MPQCADRNVAATSKSVSLNVSWGAGVGGGICTVAQLVITGRGEKMEERKKSFFRESNLAPPGARGWLMPTIPGLAPIILDKLISHQVKLSLVERTNVTSTGHIWLESNRESAMNFCEGNSN